MYAVIETGGKQYRVEQGDVIDVELLDSGAGEEMAGDKVEFDRVLMVASDKGVTVGSPTVSGAKVTGVRVGQIRAPKVVVFKMKRRKGYRRHQGHRQDMDRIRIEKIKA